MALLLKEHTYNKKKCLFGKIFFIKTINQVYKTNFTKYLKNVIEKALLHSNSLRSTNHIFR